MTRRRSARRNTIRARLLLIPLAAALLLSSASAEASAQSPETTPSRPAGSTPAAGAGGGQPATPASTPAGTVTPPSPANTPAPTAPSPAVPPLDKVQVREAYRLSYAHSTDQEARGSAGIGDIIAVRVDDLKSLVNHADCLTIDDRPVAPNCQKQELALFLDGREIKGIRPESRAPMPNDQTLQFHLDRTDESDEAWADLLGAPPPFKKEFFLRPTAVSVGFKNGHALKSEVEGDDFKLVRIRYVRFFLCLIGTVALTIFLLRYAKRSALLRDAVTTTTAGASTPFSLGRFQMAFWFYLVIVSFVFIWIITGALDIITPQVLALMGIGGGTALGAAVLDVGKSTGGTTGKFLKDILRNPTTGDISFHRFQIFVWTLVLGCIFLYSVWSRLSMPDFDATLIALMGISAGTYLGFKIPETTT